jgi:hypothetical protein
MVRKGIYNPILFKKEIRRVEKHKLFFALLFYAKEVQKWKIRKLAGGKPK